VEILDERLKNSVAQLDPSGNLDRAIARLLLEKKRRDLAKYELMCRRFRQKYNADFQSFKNQVVEKDVTYEKEQDFFDWDMALTAIEDLKAEIPHWESFLK